MRLLICNISRSLQGGVENIVADLCRNLPSRGIEPILGLARGGRFNDPDRYRAAFPDLPAMVIDGAKGTRQARLEGLLKTIRQIRPDLVLIARMFDAYEAVARLKRRQGVLVHFAHTEGDNVGYLFQRPVIDLTDYE